VENVVPLNSLFGKRLFFVPDFQRGYSWEELQVNEFLEDLELLGPHRFHYTGTVVLHEMKSVPQRMDAEGNTYDSVEIVDGQQRHTTIVLLLDGISRSLGNLSIGQSKLSEGIKKNFVSTTEDNGLPLYKLTLNQDADFFFRTVVLADRPGVAGPKITSEQRLALAKERITEYISSNFEKRGESGERWLQDLYKKVSTQLVFTLYEVKDEAEVGVIFEVMNDRGKPLTDLEKVKNFLLYTSVAIEIDNDIATSVNDAWAAILSQLMSAGLVTGDDEDRLLRANWLTRFNPKPKDWKGSKSVKEEFDLRNYVGRREDLLDSLHRYALGLRESCVCFCDAYQPSRHDSFQSFGRDPKTRRDVIEWSDKLVRIGVIAPFLPLLLAVRERWPNDGRRYLEILKLCEAYAFRVYRLTQYRADAGRSALFRLGYDLSHQKVNFEGAVERLKFEIVFRCDDDEFKSRTRRNHQQMKAAYGWNGLRYFLYEYEIALAKSKGGSPEVKWDEVRKGDLRNTIEHILPQSIDDQPSWKDAFPSPEIHQQYLHDIGNLTLTKHNPYLLNKPFLSKRGIPGGNEICYANSPLFVERDLVNWETWSPQAIEERKEKLLNWARERWGVKLNGQDGVRYEQSESDENDEDGDPMNHKYSDDADDDSQLPSSASAD